MCQQCLTKAEVIVERVLPGYSLAKATVDHPDWPKDYYGLIRYNDPDFTWKEDPIEEPFFYLSVKELDALTEDNPLVKKQNQFYHRAESIEKCFISDPMTCYELVIACKKAGYNELKHGYRVIYWLVHHMAVKMKSINKPVRETS